VWLLAWTLSFNTVSKMPFQQYQDPTVSLQPLIIDSKQEMNHDKIYCMNEQQHLNCWRYDTFKYESMPQSCDSEKTYFPVLCKIHISENCNMFMISNFSYKQRMRKSWTFLFSLSHIWQSLIIIFASPPWCHKEVGRLRSLCDIQRSKYSPILSLDGQFLENTLSCSINASNCHTLIDR